MELTPAPGFKRRPAAPSPHGITEIVKSPPPFSPSSSASSPSSGPSSPSSTSSSPSAVVTGYHNDMKDHAKGAGAAKVPRDLVSSTSASLASPCFSTPPPTNLSSDPSFRLKIACQGVDGQLGGGALEVYDPFHPTEGERDRRVEDEEEEEGEKYDPFDPTGSPASDGTEERGSDIREVRGLKRKAEVERATERGDEETKREPPPDSTDTLPSVSPPAASLPLTLKRRLDRDPNRTRERGKDRGRRDGADSDLSEIEEGEIVVASDRDGSGKKAGGGILPLPLPSGGPFFGGERILRVLDGDGFVSVCAQGDWAGDMEPDEEPLIVGVGDLRRKLVSRRKERYRSCPTSSSLSPQPPLPPALPPSPLPSSASPLLTLTPEQRSKSRKSSKSSKDRDRRKHKDRKAGDKEERRRKKKKEKEASQDQSERNKERQPKSDSKEKGRRRRSRSNSRKRKKRRQNSPETSRSHNLPGRGPHTRHSFSSLSEERHRDGERNRGKERDRDRDRDRERERERDRDQSRSSDRRRDRGRDSSRRKSDREREGRQYSSSRDRDSSKISKRSRERRERDRERQRDRDRERDRRGDGRPVVPPSIQDLNGSDLFAIKRTITVTTTTTTTTVPGSPPHVPASPRSPTQDSDKPHKRRKKRKRHSVDEAEDDRSCRSLSGSISPPRYHSYDSDHYSDKLEIDMLSLDGEALDSDYPSLEDTPPAALPPEPSAPSPKTKTTSKTTRHHPMKKSHPLKKTGQLELSASSSSRTKTKSLSSLSPTHTASTSAPISPLLPSAKRGRKLGKDKEREKNSRKESSRSSKSKKESGGSRKGKLQSKVSVLVREGVSSTTGASAGSGKLGMELLGVGGPGGSAGGPVVGGSIAVVFRRDNESRSPFLKPCSEPLSLGSRTKDLGKVGKCSSLAAPPSSSSTSPAVLKSEKAKPSSTTSTSSSASSSSSSLATKRRRRLGKKTRNKAGAGGLADGNDNQSKPSSEGWGGVSSENQSGVGGGNKSLSPHTVPPGPTPCSSSSSSSSSTSVPPPSTSPPHTPPPSTAPARDTRESSPDSQTVDSSCKTPEPSFLTEDGPTQTTLNLPPSSSPGLANSQGAGLGISLSVPNVKLLPPDDGPKSLASPPCSTSSSSSGSAPASLSLPPSSSDPSSSSSSVSSSSTSKPPPPPPPPPAAPPLPWSLQTGVDCTAGGVLALTALLFKMEEANIASRAKAQEFIQATSQILSQANQSHSQQHAPLSSASSLSSQVPPPPSLPPPPGPSPAQFILHGSLPLVGCTKTPPSHLHSGMSIGGGCAQTPPPPLSAGLSGATGSSGESGWDSESKDPDKYLKKLHTQERAVEEVKLAIKPYYQRKDINKDEYKDILRKAVHKICHSRTGEINPVKVSNLVKLYVQRYKYFRKHGRKMDEEEREDREQGIFHSST